MFYHDSIDNIYVKPITSQLSAGMAANAKAHSSSNIDSSSDDECLSVVKRKAENEENDNKIKSEDSDEESIMAGVLVTVEVEEMDDACPLEFTKVWQQYYK